MIQWWPLWGQRSGGTLGLSSNVFTTQLSEQKQGSGCRLCIFLWYRYSIDGFQALIVTQWGGVRKRSVKVYLHHQLTGFTISAAMHAWRSLRDCFQKGLTEKPKLTINEDGTILRDKVLDWIKGKEWATQHHPSLSASDCTCNVTSCLIHLLLQLPKARWNCHSHPQTVSYNKPSLP